MKKSQPFTKPPPLFRHWRQGSAEGITDQEPHEAHGEAEEERVFLPQRVGVSANFHGPDVGAPGVVVGPHLGDAKVVDDDAHHAEEETRYTGRGGFSSFPEETHE